MNHLEFKPLIEQLQSRATRSVVSQYAFKSKPLTDYLRRVYSAQPGEDGALLADPVFEPMFPWTQASTELEDLRGGLLTAHMMKMLNGFKYPFEHQLTAWRQILEEQKSVLVSSGTGSGKTECFLVPILEDLVRQQKSQKKQLVGTQALFLYPLNALINSQQERLSKWTKDLKGNVRFALYNGETQRYKSDVKEEQQKYPEQVLSREELWENPPSILVTNATMLEYMLVRKEDQPILDNSKRMLKYIVLDEAHTYIGSHAAELALLLRRVMSSFDVGPGTDNKVQIIATSATIGEDSKSGNQKLAKYIANLAGVSEAELEEKVEVVRGYREIEPLNKHSSYSSSFDFDEANRKREESPEALYDFLEQHTLSRRVRSLFEGDERILQHFGFSHTSAYKLSQIKEVAKLFEPEIKTEEILHLLDLMSYGKREEQAFVPLRAHLFQRALSGLWACVDKNCTHQALELDSPDWQFGQVYLDNRTTCLCGAPVMELLSCNGCGSSYLAAEEYLKLGISQIKARSLGLEEDEFILDQEMDISEDDDEGRSSGFERLIGGSDGHTKLGVEESNFGVLDAKDGKTAAISVITPHITESTGRKGFKCPSCHEKEYRPGSLFRYARLGAPFFLGDIIPTMLELSPLPRTESERLNPSSGKRLLTFTDSRQGTARISARLQQDADRNANRTSIYHEIVNLEVASKAEASQVQIELITDIANQYRMLSPITATALDKLVSGDDLSTEDLNQIASVKTMFAGQDDKIDAIEALLSNSSSGSTAETHSFTWKKLVSSIVETNSSFIRRKSRLEKTSGLNLTDNDYADFSLFSEFSFRPKKTWSLETLGLASISYPDISQLTKVPDSWKSFVTDPLLQVAEWKNFLKIVLDYYVRTNGAVFLDNNEYRHWLGSKRVRKVLKDPSVHKKQDVYDLLWPRIHDKGHNHIIKLLLAVFPQILPEEKYWRDRVDELMGDAWRALHPNFKSQDAGMQLDLKEKATFSSPSEVWICPYTRKAIDVVLLGYSPYLSRFENRDSFIAKKVEMPKLPARHWQSEDGAWDLSKRLAWLESNPVVLAARDENIWPNRSDRLAVKENWYSLEEHSAQQSPDTNKANEAKFKSGKLNVLNCSTTMEMGVDIGDMSLVAMNNVPPASANYLQRAGRAGRRGETAAAAVTLCKNTPHGMEVFTNPMWPFTSQAQPPQVRLESESIVQRHVNAFALGSYLKEKTSNATKLNCEWFFEGKVPHSQKFVAWLSEQKSSEDNLEWITKVQALVKGTKISQRSIKSLLNHVAQSIQKVENYWKEQLDVMLSNIEEMKASDKQWESNPAGKSILFQLKDFRSSYLFNTLASNGFLPGHGFPIGVVTFNYKTAAELEFSRIRESDVSDVKAKYQRTFESLPSRDLPTALREYAPGSDVVLNGKVYRSGGVQLGKVLSSGSELKNDTHHLPFYWHCHKCGAGATQHTWPKACSHCNAELKGENIHQYLQPIGFATDIRYQVHNDVSEPRQVPFNPPRAILPASNWLALPDPELGRYRYSSSGQLYYYSDGEAGQGYAVCLSCGRAESQHEKGRTPDRLRDPQLEKSHYRLRGGRTGEGNTKADKICHGTIKTDLHLGYSAKTEIIEIQLNDKDGNPLKDEVQAWSLVVALREGLARTLGIETRELGFSVQQSKSKDDEVMYSLFIYDQSSGGAGYASQIAENWQKVFKQAENVITCNCDSVCHRCLLTFDTQFVLENLNRTELAKWLSPPVYNRFDLEPQYQVYGSHTQFEHLDLIDRAKLELGKGGAEECLIRIGSVNDDWDLTKWPIFDDLIVYSIQHSGSVTLLISKEDFDSLVGENKQQLARLLDIPGTKFSLKVLSPSALEKEVPVDFGFKRNGTWVLWNKVGATDLPLNSNWALSDEGLSVFAYLDSYSPEGQTTGVEVKELRRVSTDVRKNFQYELDGPVEEFGHRFWEFIFSAKPELKALLANKNVSNVHYNDRFLKSPHTIRLFGEVVNQLNQHSNLDRSSIEIRCNSLDGSKPKPQEYCHDDWKNDAIRERCIKELLSEGYLGDSINGQIKVTVGDKTGFDVQHGRELTVTFDSGERYYIILDYGLSYWKVRGFKNYHFAASESEQINQIAGMNYDLAGSEYIKTYMIIGKVES
jgi:DEAD/DEAH box helicase domain-containing protein